MFAIASVWIASGALTTTVFMVIYLAVRPAVDAQIAVTLLPYTVALSATLAAEVLWAHRKRPAADPGVGGQRLQALAAHGLNALNFAILLFWLHGPLKGLLGLAVEALFLWACYRGYLRIVLRERE